MPIADVKLVMNAKNFQVTLNYLAAHGECWEHLKPLMYLGGAGCLKAGYHAAENAYAAELAANLIGLTFDFIVAAPTSLPEVLQPYLDAMHSTFPTARNISTLFSRAGNVKSGRGNAPFLDLLAEIQFNAPADFGSAKPAEVLLVDDCLSSGKTACVMISHLSTHLPNACFTFAVPYFVNSGLISETEG